MKILDFLDLFISLNVIILGIIIFLNLAKKSIYYIFFGTANLFVGSGILLDSIIKLNPGIFWYTMGLEYPCGLMLGPIIWMLSIASVKNKFHWKFKLYLSIAPVLLVLLSYLILWDLPLLRRRLFEQALNHRNVIFHDLDIFTYLYILFFLILALVRITKIRNHRFRDLRAAERSRVNLVYLFLLFHLLVAPLTAIAFYFRNITGQHTLMSLASLPMYLFFVYKIFKQANLEESGKPISRKHNPEITAKRPGSATDPDQPVIARLYQHIRDNKPYLDGDLSINSLSGQLGIHPHELSELLNNRIGKNFNDFINEFRLEHARVMLLNGESLKFKVDSIGQQSGFSSRTVFYDSFRKQTGLTPMEYRNKFLENDTK